MDNHFYFWIIKKTITQFANVFNNIKIAKYNEDGSIKKTIEVPVKLSSKQKFYYWLYDRKHEKMLPMMAVNFTGLSPALNNRGTDSNYFKVPASKGETSTYKKPIPWDYTFELYITANYMLDIEQILEQIIPWFTPYIMININIPEINNNLDLKVICNSVSQDKEVEIPEDDYRTINWTLDFTVKGYMLKPVSDSSIIHEINLEFKNIEDYKLYSKLELDENDYPNGE